MEVVVEPPPLGSSSMVQGSNTSVGNGDVNELDDIMDLIGSFPDVVGNHHHRQCQPPPTSQGSSSSSATTTFMTPLTDFPLAPHPDQHATTSPMSPWSFYNDTSLTFQNGGITTANSSENFGNSFHHHGGT